MRLLRFLVLFSVVALLLACRKPPADVAPEPPIVNDTSAGLLLTWIDDKGEFHVEESVANVPEAARELVRVADPNKEAPTGERIFVADLRAAGPDGAYAVRLVARTEFEGVAVERRKKHGSVLAAAPPGSAPGSAASGAGAGADEGRPPVIIYGASWCGPCHQAAAYLKQKGVRFVEHDIEQDSVAAREMRAKLAKAGRSGGSIPVLDVKGTILVGFDAAAVDRALGRAM